MTVNKLINTLSSNINKFGNKNRENIRKIMGVPFAEFFILRITTDPEYYTLTVNLLPSGIGGRWSIDSQQTWHESGDTLNLPAFLTYAIDYEEVSGYGTPDQFSVYLTSNRVVTATYT